jgi:hypothetical protein
MDEIKFYLDENVANAVAEGLRHRGIDVITTPEAGHKGWNDLDQLTFALSEQRVLVTEDDDLLSIASAGVEHAGIAFYPPRSRTVKLIIRDLSLIYDVLSQEEMTNHIEYI